MGLRIACFFFIFLGFFVLVAVVTFPLLCFPFFVLFFGPMGCGASQVADVKAGAPGTPAAANGRSFFVKVFTEACEALDPEGTGVLSPSLFWETVTGGSSALCVSPREAQALRAAVDQHGIEAAYGPLLGDVYAALLRLYHAKEVDWNDWCLLTAPRTGAARYFNKRTGRLAAHKPRQFSPAFIDEDAFEAFVRSDGQLLTTMTASDGQRMYLDMHERVKEKRKEKKKEKN